MRIQELHKPEEIIKARQLSQGPIRQLLVQALAKRGFTPLGVGTFGSVYAHPGYPWVLKLFSDDPYYRVWFSFCRENPSNPFLPKTKGNVVNIVDDIFAVRLEPLNKIEGPEQFTKSRMIQLFIRGRVHVDDLARSFTKEDITHLKQIKEYLRDYTRFLDLHDENLMVRPDGHLVITDPLAP